MAINPPNYYHNREIWNSQTPGRIYVDEMRWIGLGVKIPWKNDSDGSIEIKEYVPKKMSSAEIKSLEKELISSGCIREAERIHQYREFRVKKRLAERNALRRCLPVMRENFLAKVSESGVDLTCISPKDLDKLVIAIEGKPRILSLE